jgi:type II secretory pathway predicted ATPase ExeA
MKKWGSIKREKVFSILTNITKKQTGQITFLVKPRFMQGKRYFNTSGPNIAKEHYTLFRKNLIEKGKDLVEKNRYFTIWAPRQTGKSTLFRQLAVELEKEGYKVCHINFENYKEASLESFLSTLISEINHSWKTEYPRTELSTFFQMIRETLNQKLVLIIDEVEGINTEYLGQFLHSIRNLYHSRETHSLKSVILVGVSNITGIMQDHASPFNIADELNVPYFTNAETKDLLEQHTTETGQVFSEDVIAKISEITANQPGLVNGFAKQLIDRYPLTNPLTMAEYERVENWYLNEAIDKNVANILKIGEMHKSFLERLLFREESIPFEIDRPATKTLHVNGLIKNDANNNIEFWVPLYRKRLFKALYPYSNGESRRMAGNLLAESYLLEDKKINFPKLIDAYKDHIRARSFRPFREKDETGKYKSIPEAAMIYSFETFISIFIQELDGRIYREAFAALGNTDMIITACGHEYFLEMKKYYSPSYFRKGKKQLAYYCKSGGTHRKPMREGYYIVFVDNTINPEYVPDQPEIIDGIVIHTFLIWYDEEKDF